MKKSRKIERNEKMEKLMNESTEAIKELEKSLNRFSRNQKKIDELADYYFSKDWAKDFADDEKGRFPQELKRGILSEDGIYNLLCDNDDLIKKMQRLLRKQTGDIKNK